MDYGLLYKYGVWIIYDQMLTVNNLVRRNLVIVV
jgi:hypothetical protein